MTVCFGGFLPGMRDNISTIDGKIKMFSGFMPDGIFDDIYAITPEFLLSLGGQGAETRH